MSIPDLHGWKFRVKSEHNVIPHFVEVTNKDGAKFEIHENGIEVVDLGDGYSFLQHDVIKRALDEIWWANLHSKAPRIRRRPKRRKA